MNETPSRVLLQNLPLMSKALMNICECPIYLLDGKCRTSMGPVAQFHWAASGLVIKGPTLVNGIALSRKVSMAWPT